MKTRSLARQMFYHMHKHKQTSHHVAHYFGVKEHYAVDLMTKYPEERKYVLESLKGDGA